MGAAEDHRPEGDDMTSNITKPWASNMPRVAKLPWPGIEGAFLCMSGKRAVSTKAGWKWHADPATKVQEQDVTEGSQPCVTFTVISGDVAAEWDGSSGPIQIWYRAPEGYDVNYDKAEPHWLWPFAIGKGHWSQLAVEEEDLPGAFVRGDYEWIFGVLRRWATSHDARWNYEGGFV